MWAYGYFRAWAAILERAWDTCKHLSYTHLALYTSMDGCVLPWLMITTLIRVHHLWPTNECTYQVILCLTTRNRDPWFLNLPCVLLFKCNCVNWHFLKHFLFLLSDLLQPQWEQDYGQRCSCNCHSFTSEPEPSEAKVSPAIHVLLLKSCTLVLQQQSNYYQVQYSVVWF